MTEPSIPARKRARRRAEERGLGPDSPETAVILADLRRRDRLDSSRAVAPMRVPDDAVIVRSDDRTFEESVDAVVAIIEAAEQDTQGE